MTKTLKKVYFTWEQFDDAVNFIANSLDHKGITSELGCVYGMPRGGLVVAVKISHLLNIPLVPSIEVGALYGKKILIVDDISDTGKTFNRISEWSKLDVNLYDRICSACIHYTDWSIFEPTIWYQKKKLNSWITYPWEI
jgi:hypoxanthine phosphoribosyltransferase